MKILSIDAWGNSCGECDACLYYKKHGKDAPTNTQGCWTWNNWHIVGQLDAIPNTDIEIVDLFIELGMLKPSAKTLVEIYDDGFNIVIQNKTTSEPLLAIQYGS